MRIFVVILLLSLRAFAPLARAEASALSLDQAISQLHSGNEDQRVAANEALLAMAQKGLTVEQGLQIIRETTKGENRATTQQSDHSVAAQLLDKLKQDPKPQYIKPILEAYDDYPPDAKPTALAIFIALGPGDGLKAYLSKLNDKSETDAACDQAFAKLDGRDPEVLAALLASLTYELTSGTAVATLQTFAEKGKLPPGVLSDHLDEIVRSYQFWLDKLAAARKALKDDPDYRWNDSYCQAEEVAEYFPDLLGYSGDKAEPILQKTAEVDDLRIQLFAVRALMQLHKNPPLDAIKKVAANDETRNMLYDACEKFDRRSLFPNEFCTQDAFARSEMVNWLIYPTELGRAPNEIEQMKVVSQDMGGIEGTVEIYVFRFRTTGTHWAAKDGWMVGIAGAYRKSDEPTTTSLGDTFSDFAKWDAKTPDEHVKDITDLLSQARKNGGK